MVSFASLLFDGVDSEGRANNPTYALLMKWIGVSRICVRTVGLGRPSGMS